MACQGGVAWAASGFETGVAWLRLLHYERQGDGYRSGIDSPEFFLAPEGPNDPAAELRALTETARSSPAALAALTCRFPARVLYLKEHGAPDLPFEPCPELRHWYETLDGDAVSVLFASQYAGNPASRFGHTFLHFARPVTYGSQRLGTADAIVSYAASIGDVGPLTYAFKGLFGGFQGYFSVSTLTQTLKEYADMEDRSLWDYRLRLTRDQRDRLIYHLYELRKQWAWYWFTLQNCSYELLAALAAAVPELDMLDRFRMYFLPVEVLQGLMEANLVESVHYYPSSGDEFRLAAARLDAADRERFRVALATGELGSAGVEVLDALIFYADYRQAADKAFLPHIAALKERAMTRRATLPRGIPAPPPAPPTAPPHRTWPLGRLGIGAGQGRALLRARPLIHDLLNSDEGLTPGEELSLLDLSLAYSPTERRAEVANFVAFRSVVLRPVTFERLPMSWDLALEGRPTSIFGARRPWIRADARVGWTAGTDDRSMLVYGLVSAAAFARLQAPIVAGPRAHLGVLIGGDRAKIHLVHRAMLGVTGLPNRVQIRTTEAGFAVYWAPRLQLDLTGWEERWAAGRERDVAVMLSRFF